MADEGFFSGLWGSMARMLLFYYVISMFIGKPSEPGYTVNTVRDGKDTQVTLTHFDPVWRSNEDLQLKVYLSEHATSAEATDWLVWQQDGIVYGNWDDVRQLELDINCPEHVQNNGSLFAHIFLSVTASDSHPLHQSFDAYKTLYLRKMLTRYMPKIKERKTKKLLSHSEESTENETDETNPIVSYWWPNITINLVPSVEPMPVKLPPLVNKHVRLSPDGTKFLPFFHVNDFWMLQDQLLPISTANETLHLSLYFSPLAMWRFQLYLQFEESFRMQTDRMGLEKKESEQMKRMVLETNPILLAITIAVSLLHSVFDFLAFKNDIDFWKNKKDMEGMSFRSIIFNVISQAIVLLYLLDNDTSWMILISNGVGLLIEVWKIHKTVIVTRTPQFPYFVFIDRVKPSKLTAKTRKYDEIAFRYLSYLLFPLLIGYTVYSVFYEEHKGWYSFILGTLVGFVYAFGFIAMCPQLFINYKLKSVAHMPWKTFMYKALNTFIDDLFAFVIKMPTLHRLACLRDDVVFLVYLYQRWIYPEDKRRRNEFGQVGEKTDGDNDDDDDEVSPVDSKPAIADSKSSKKPIAKESKKPIAKESKKDK